MPHPGHRGGHSPVADVAHRLKTGNITIESLYVERGRLDDVFRMLTTDALGGQTGHA
jgi:hypothetical protein